MVSVRNLTQTDWRTTCLLEPSWSRFSHLFLRFPLRLAGDVRGRPAPPLAPSFLCLFGTALVPHQPALLPGLRRPPVHSWLAWAWEAWIPPGGTALYVPHTESLGLLRTQCILRSLCGLIRRRPESSSGATRLLPQLLLPRCPAAFLPRGVAGPGPGSPRVRWAGLGGSTLAWPMLPGFVAAQARPRAEGGCTHITSHEPPAGGLVLLGGISWGHGLLWGALGTDGVPLRGVVSSSEALRGAGSGDTGCAPGRCGSAPAELRGRAGGSWGPAGSSSGLHGTRAAGPRHAFWAGIGTWPWGPPCGRVGGHSDDTLAFSAA